MGTMNIFFHESCANYRLVYDVKVSKYVCMYLSMGKYTIWEIAHLLISPNCVSALHNSTRTAAVKEQDVRICKAEQAMV